MAREPKLRAAVDLPNPHDIEGEMVNLNYFETKKQAIAWARKNLGADSKGRICVVSTLPQD
jgi:hypothetical protein